MSRSMLASIGLLCLSACGGGYTYVPPAPLLVLVGVVEERLRRCMVMAKGEQVKAFEAATGALKARFFTFRF